MSSQTGHESRSASGRGLDLPGVGREILLGAMDTHNGAPEKTLPIAPACCLGLLHISLTLHTVQRGGARVG